MIFQNTFSGNIDKDTSVTKRDASCPYHVENFRILTDGGTTSGSLENVHGNKHLFSIPDDIFRYSTTAANFFHFKYIGHAWVRKDLVVACSVFNKLYLNPTSSSFTKYKDVIFYLKETDIQYAIDNDIDITFSYLQTTGSDLTASTYYWEQDNTDGTHDDGVWACTAYIGDLGFNSTVVSVTASDVDLSYNTLTASEGRYENEYTKKVYLSDATTPEVNINLVYNASTNNLKTLTVDKVAMVPNLEIVTPTLDSILSGGNLKAGMIQYAYQLFSVSGASSVISPATKLYHITSSDESGTLSNYEGSDIETVCGKSYRIKISLTNGGGKIKLIAIFYETLYADPQIRVVDERDAIAGDMYFVDTGQSVGTLTVSEFVNYPQNFATATMASKNNILYNANITDDAFDVDYDARAYAFSSYIESSTYARTLESTPRTLVSEGDSISYTVYGLEIVYNSTTPSDSRAYFLNATGSYIGGSAYVMWVNIPSDWDLAVGQYTGGANVYENNVFDVIGKDRVFRYMPNGDSYTTYGGLGPNVSYYIYSTQSTKLASGIDALTGASSVMNGSVSVSVANPQNNMTFQSDEVYRFAVVLFDEKGNPSFPKWVADVRFPSGRNGTVTDVVQYINPSTGVVTTKQNINRPELDSLGIMTKDSLGIVMTLSNLPASAKYAQVVCVPRTRGDMSIKTQGFLTGSLNFSPFETGGTNIADAVTPHPFPVYASNGLPSYFGTSNNLTQYAWLFSTDISRGEVTPTTSGKLRVAYSVAAMQCRKTQPSSISGLFYDGYLNLAYANYTTYSISDTVDSSIHVNKFQVVIPRYKAGISQSVQEKNGATWITDAEVDLDEVWAMSGDVDKNGIKSGVGVVADGTTSIVPWVVTHQTNNSTTDTPRSEGILAKCMAVKLSASLPAWNFYQSDVTDPYYHIVNYIEDVFNAQYGGWTNTARQLNTYIPCGNVVSVTAGVATPLATRGDMFNVMNEQLYCSADVDNPNDRAYCCVVEYPCEMVVNAELSNGFFYRKNAGASNYFLMQEKAGSYTEQTNATYTLAQNKDYYAYNTAYSQKDTTRGYIAEPAGYVPILAHDTRIVASNVKTNSELEDSWTKYDAASYIEVDGQYGAISKIINFKGQLYAFQPEGVSMISTQERELLSGQNNAGLILGTGTVLQRYDYLSRNTGTAYPDSVVQTDEAVYYYDGNNKEVMIMQGGQTASLSEIKGLHSFIANINPISCIGIWNIRFNEVIWTLTGTENGSTVTYTIAYNEASKGFSAFYTYKPSFYIKMDNTFLSCEKSVTAQGFGQEFWRHNGSDKYCDWYVGYADGGTNTLGRTDLSKITLIVNPQQVVVDRFDVLEFATVATDTLNDIEKDVTFTRLRVSNDSQDTDWVTLSPRKNITKRNRVWYYNSMRQIKDMWGRLTKNNARMVGSHLKIQLEFTNDGNTHFVVNDFVTKFTQKLNLQIK